MPGRDYQILGVERGSCLTRKGFARHSPRRAGFGQAEQGIQHFDLSSDASLIFPALTDVMDDSARSSAVIKVTSDE